MHYTHHFLRQILIGSLLTMVCCGLLRTGATAQSQNPSLDPYGRWINGITEPWHFPEAFPETDSHAAQQLWQGIGEQSEVNLWEGTYSNGSGTHGSYLRWSPQIGFVLFHVNKCEASVMGFSYGKVAASSTLIEMSPEKTVSSATNHGHGSTSPKTLRYLPVVWRQDRYLVPENEVSDFADYVAGLGRYNDRNFLFGEHEEYFSKSTRLSEGQDQPAVDGRRTSDNDFVKPLFPPGYERLIKKPIEAKIIAQRKPYVKHNSENDWWNDLIIPVSVNAGSRQGLKKKMVLRILDSAGFAGDSEYVEITRLDLNSAQGIIQRSVRKRPCIKFAPTDDCKDPDYQPIKVGSRVTTNPVRGIMNSNH